MLQLRRRHNDRFWVEGVAGYCFEEFISLWVSGFIIFFSSSFEPFIFEFGWEGSVACHSCKYQHINSNEYM